MSRNTALSLLSHPAIEWLAHFLFLLLLKCFSGDARNNAFLQQARSLGVVIRAIFELCDRFLRTEFPFGRSGKLGLLSTFLIKTAPSAMPGRWYIFFCWTQVFLWKKDYPGFLLTNEFSGPRSRMTTSSCRNKKIQFSGKENSAVFSKNVLNQTAFPPQTYKALLYPLPSNTYSQSLN